MTRDGTHRRSVSLSGALYRTLAAWAYVGQIAVSAALEISIRQWHARITPGVIEEWVAAGNRLSIGLRRAPGEPPRRMVSVGKDAFGILALRAPELHVSKSLLAEFCVACRVQRAVSYREVLDHFDAVDDRTETARAAYLARTSAKRAARLEQTIDVRTTRTVERRLQRAHEAREFEERLARKREAYHASDESERRR